MGYLALTLYNKIIPCISMFYKMTFGHIIVHYNHGIIYEKSSDFIRNTPA